MITTAVVLILCVLTTVAVKVPDKRQTGCQDQVANCNAYGQSVCGDPQYALWAEQNCKKFCNKCGGGVPQLPIGVPTLSAAAGCQDQVANCNAYGQSVCGDPQYALWAEQNCKKFCNKCGGGGPVGLPTAAPGGSCQDKMANCDNYGQAVCGDPQYAQWAKENCMKFCNLCGSGPATPQGAPIVTQPPASITGAGSGCVYKGQIYQHMQKWDDGCDYTCTCVDGSQGKYQCTTKCLQWNLPDECHMDPPPAGKCCPVPKCPPSITVQLPPGYTPA